MKPRQLIPVLYLGCIFSAAACSTGDDKKTTPATAAVNVQDTLTAPAAVTTKEKSREDKILDSIQKLPFIIAAHKNIDSFSHHKNGIAFLVDSSEKEWMIQAGYNGANRFETYHRLYVNPATFDIKVYDVVTDEKLSVADYLKKDDQ